MFMRSSGAGAHAPAGRVETQLRPQHADESAVQRRAAHGGAGTH
jgi:hypothetical protein